MKIRFSFLLIALAACSEPLRKAADAPHAAAAPTLRVELSDSTPAPNSTVRVTIRARGVALASITGRLSFDTAAMTFAQETSMSDGATRVINPMPGIVRFAAVAPDSFANGIIHQVEFVVRTPAGLRSLALALDEAHTPARLDVTRSLTVAR